MEVAKELFAIPQGSNFVLYAPLEGAALEVTPGVVGFLQKVQAGENPSQLNPDLTRRLQKARILVDRSRDPKRLERKVGYQPTAVTLLPTYDCNLRCSYCYAAAGEDSSGQQVQLSVKPTPLEGLGVMNPRVARGAVDLIVENALANKTDKVSLSFHGGGEPLLGKNMPLVKEAVGYFKQRAGEHNLKTNIGAVSNGTFGRETLEWVVGNFNSLSLSIDGPKDVQDIQRPWKAGSSYDAVMNTLRFFEARGFKYGIRATITADSVRRMPEIIEFFHANSKNKSFHLEPLFECGRCSTTKAKSPDPQEYVENMIRTLDRAEELGVEVYYSGGSVDRVGLTFCGAAGSNFFVTPRGQVTTCLEVCRPEDTHAQTFFVGKYDFKQGKFVFDQSRIAALGERQVTSMPYCGDCFAKYTCSGDCLAKVVEQSGDMMNPENNWRCEVNRQLLLYRINKLLKKEDTEVV